MAPQTKYNSKYHDDWAWSLVIKGATDKEIAEAFGLSERTINRWKNEYETFKTAMEAGKEAADAKVERSLYERAIGYEEVEEKESVMEIDKDGNRKPLKVRTVKKRILPDTMAGMYWLNNRQRKNWSQRQDVNVNSTNTNVDLSGLSDDELRQLIKLAPEEELKGG